MLTKTRIGRDVAARQVACAITNRSQHPDADVESSAGTHLWA